LCTDSSIHSVDQSVAGPGGNNETISGSLYQRFHDDLFSPQAAMCDYTIFTVTLEKQHDHGFGITLVGGATHQPQGLFVKKVCADGPAWNDGRIKPGDQILRINSRPVQHLQHHEAVNLFKQAAGSITLQIAQVKPPGSLKKTDPDDDFYGSDVDSDAEFQWKLQNSYREHTDFKAHMDLYRGGGEALGKAESPVSSVNSNSPVNNSTVKTNKSASKKMENDIHITEKNASVDVNEAMSIPVCLSDTEVELEGTVVMSANVDVTDQRPLSVEPQDCSGEMVDLRPVTAATAHSSLAPVHTLHSETRAPGGTLHSEHGRSKHEKMSTGVWL